MKKHFLVLSLDSFHIGIPNIIMNTFFEKVINLNTISKIRLKCNVIDGSVGNGIQDPVLFCFILDKPSGCKIFCPAETVDYKKLIKIILKTVIFYLEDENNEEFNFNGKILTFTLQLIKI